jgi:diguanylate cyclase (GGDEF)-like protein
MWFSLAVFATVWTNGVRAQRLELSRQGENARRSAYTDPLTGLGNRRAFDEALTAELARARLSRQPLSVLLADLNDFKRVNDRFGHLNGDHCLREVADVLRIAMRRLDRCFRWGGDEFAILLPETDRAGAEDFALRLHDQVRASCFNPDGDALTIVTGSAELRPEMPHHELLAEADFALMSAKTQLTEGRGRRFRATPA